MDVEVQKTLIWAGVVIVALLMFRRSIAAAMDRVTEFRLRNLIIAAGSGSFREPGSKGAGEPREGWSPKAVQLVALAEEPDRAWHAYWLGHDVMWTIAVTAGGASKDKIAHGLTTAYHHAESLGLPPELLEELETLIREVKQTRRLGSTERQELITRLSEVKTQVGALFEV